MPDLTSHIPILVPLQTKSHPQSLTHAHTHIYTGKENRTFLAYGKRLWRPEAFSLSLFLSCCCSVTWVILIPEDWMCVCCVVVREREGCWRWMYECDMYRESWIAEATISSVQPGTCMTSSYQWIILIWEELLASKRMIHPNEIHQMDLDEAGGLDIMCIHPSMFLFSSCSTYRK